MQSASAPKLPTEVKEFTSKSKKKAPQLMNHMTWQRKGYADDVPSSPFHILHITAQERDHTGPIKDRNYSLLNQPLPLPTFSPTSLSSPSQSSSPSNSPSHLPSSSQPNGSDSHASSSDTDYWHRSYRDPRLPLIVDIGCGAGRFALYLAHLLAINDPSAMQSLASALPLLHPLPTSSSPSSTSSSSHQPLAFNVLGIDIQAAQINRAIHWATNRPYLKSHLHYCIANASSSTSQLLASYPGPIALASVQYPDPHERTDRHVVNQGFVVDLAGLLRAGSRVLLQSELEATAGHMWDEFETYGSHLFVPLNPKRGIENGLNPKRGPEIENGINPTTSISVDNLGESLKGAKDAREASGVRLGYTGGVRERIQNKDDPSCSPLSSPDPTIVTSQQLLWGREFDWLEENPLGDVPTEREVYMRQVLPGEKVYRILLARLPSQNIL